MKHGLIYTVLRSKLVILQHFIKDVSTVHEAFDISNFTKVEDHPNGTIYWFKTLQKFQVNMFAGKVNYSNSLYGRSDVKINENIGRAFLELANHIDTINKIKGSTGKTLNIRVDPSGLTPTSYIGVDMGQESYSVVASNPLYCSCIAPKVEERSTLVDKFNFCTGCKKEHIVGNVEVPNENDWDGYVPF